jgi:DNA-binding PadR family transcriptional regulator
LADKSTRLIVDALAKAAAEPAGFPLVSTKSEPGLFPATALAKSAAERAKNDGLLRTVMHESPTRGAREVCVVTDKGLQMLVRQPSAKQVVEDLVRALEERQSAVDELTASAARMADGIKTIRSAIDQVLPHLLEQNAQNGNAMNATLTAPTKQTVAHHDNAHSLEMLIADIKARLSEWHASASQDCPLPELFRQLENRKRVSVGQFHDALRQLHDDSQLYLHPWTGPLYTLPEPAFALMVGHEVAYYASIR